ncbi:MAG: hypothetical protein ACK5O2_09725 [Microthrixaceae bacterium]
MLGVLVAVVGLGAPAASAGAVTGAGNGVAAINPGTAPAVAEQGPVSPGSVEVSGLVFDDRAVVSLVTPSGAPARFIDFRGTTIDRASIRTTVSVQRQGRHVLGDRLYNGGGYFRDAGSPQRVLDAFHDGSLQILGVTRNGHVVVRVPSVTGFNNNPTAGFVDQATNVFFIKGSSSPSVVPTNPNWAP